jgi:hypothetical protein
MPPECFGVELAKAELNARRRELLSQKSDRVAMEDIGELASNLCSPYTAFGKPTSRNGADRHEVILSPHRLQLSK